MSSLALLVPGSPGGTRARRLLVATASRPTRRGWSRACCTRPSRPRPAAGSVFGLGDEGSLPGPLAALTLGGIWNGEVVPGSRDSLVLTLAATVAVLAAAVAGARPLWQRLGARTCGSLVALWTVGYAVAVFTWTSPGAVGWVASHVPGGGLLRDGSRVLALCAPLTAALVAAAAERLAARWHDSGPRVLVAVPRPCCRWR